MSARAAIYLDANAGIPPLSQIREGIEEVLPQLHNASSIHEHGRRARALITRAQGQVTRSLSRLLPGLRGDSWVFTSGGTEALQGVLRAAAHAGLPRIAQSVEHSASLPAPSQVARFFPLDRLGRIDLDELDRIEAFLDSAATTQPFLASLLWVNNETGAIQHRITELCKRLKRAGALVLIDGAQAWGKHPGELEPGSWDFFAASGHKIGAFAGTGVLAFSESGRKLLQAAPLFAGSQQQRLRAGTENPLGAWALGIAAELDIWREAASDGSELLRQRNDLAGSILARIPGARLHVPLEACIHNTLSVGFESGGGAMLVERLDLEGFSVSAGSACSSGIRQPSNVLRALGCSDELALASLRISLPPAVESSSLNAFVDALCRVLGVMPEKTG